MKYLFVPFFLFTLLEMCGCTPSYRVKTDAMNYRDKLSIEKEEYELFNGEYIGTGKNCFPPIEKSICNNYTGNEVYKPTKELKMEIFSISIKDTSVTTTKVVKDMAHLTAAELAQQRGFKTFTVLYTMESYSCGSIYSVNTLGNVSGNSYSGTSYLSKDSICANGYSMKVLLYNEPDDLKNGVLYRTPYSSKLQPFKSLYVGTTPGLHEEVLKQRIEDLEKKQPIRLVTSNNAWKTQFDIDGLAVELKNQYGLSEKLPYTFEDARERHKKIKEMKDADPIEKFKVTK